jgi:hypothetical protein
MRGWCGLGGLRIAGSIPTNCYTIYPHTTKGPHMLHDVSDEWRKEHGIGREELNAQQIKRYRKDDTTDVEAEFLAQLPGTSRSIVAQRARVTQWARADFLDIPDERIAEDGLVRDELGGLLIRHHAPGWMDIDPVVTQLRPDYDIPTGERQRHSAHYDVRFWQFHIARHPDHGNQRHLTDAEVEALGDAELRALRDGGAVRGDREHDHWERAKYLHAPTPYVTEVHDHAIAYAGKPSMRASHVYTDHGGIDREVPHDYKHKDKTVTYAKRVDVSPLLDEDDFKRAERFYLVIEGSIKMLAVLTWLRRHRENAVVLSVPAVGQWNAPELWELAETYMAGKLGLIIADSDAHQNSQVMEQAIRLRRRLRRRSVGAHILLPPEGVLGEGKKVGADDALGKAGQSLHDFQIIHREPAYTGIQRLITKTQGWREKSWREIREPSVAPHYSYERDPGARIQVKAHTLSNRTWPGRTRNWDVLIALSEQANIETGLYWGSLRRLEGDLEMSHASALKAIEELEEGEFIERTAGSLETEESEYSYAMSYLDRPEWRIHEDIRAIQTTQRYGDFLEERKENDGHNGSAS